MKENHGHLLPVAMVTKCSEHAKEQRYTGRVQGGGKRGLVRQRLKNIWWLHSFNPGDPVLLLHQCLLPNTSIIQQCRQVGVGEHLWRHQTCASHVLSTHMAQERETDWGLYEEKYHREEVEKSTEPVTHVKNKECQKSEDRVPKQDTQREINLCLI